MDAANCCVILKETSRILAFPQYILRALKGQLYADKLPCIPGHDKARILLKGCIAGSSRFLTLWASSVCCRESMSHVNS